MRASLAAAAALALIAPSATAQITTQKPQPAPTVVDTLGAPEMPEAGSGGEEGAKVSFSPKVYAPFLWSPTAGLGVGYGVEVQNLGWSGSSVLVTGITSQRIGRYGVYATTRTPYAPGVNAMLGGTFETTGRRYFYGIGPFSDIDNKIAVEKQTYEAEARVGYSTEPRATRRVQAFGRYQFHQTRTARNLKAGAQSRLDSVSAANLTFALAHDVGAVTGGVEGIWDERNNIYVPKYGFIGQVGVSYTTAVSGADVSFLRTYGSFNYFLPIEWRNSTIHARAIVSSVDGVRGDDPVPFFLLPTFDTDYGLGLATQRFYANDYFLVSGELQTPVFVTGALDIDAIAGVTLYNAYDDIAKQFLPIRWPLTGKTTTATRCVWRWAAAFGCLRRSCPASCCTANSASAPKACRSPRSTSLPTSAPSARSCAGCKTTEALPPRRELPAGGHHRVADGYASAIRPVHPAVRRACLRTSDRPCGVCGRAARRPNDVVHPRGARSQQRLARPGGSALRRHRLLVPRRLYSDGRRPAVGV